MDPYSSYVSVVPRILPGQESSKKIMMSDEAPHYVDTRPSSYGSPSSLINHSPSQQPLSTRTQLMANDINHQEVALSNSSFPSNIIDGSAKGRTKNRIHHEALKDNSRDIGSRNSPPGYVYPPNYERPYENGKMNDPMNNNNQWPKTLIIVFVSVIGLFAITALAISIYLLIRITTT